MRKQDWVALMSKPIALFLKIWKNYFRLKIFFCQKNFCQKKFLVKKFFWSKKIFAEIFFGQTKILVKKNSCRNSFSSKEFSFKKNILVKKFFLVKKNVGQRKLYENNFSIKKILVNFFFGFLSKKNLVGLTLGRGFMTHPPSPGKNG